MTTKEATRQLERLALAAERPDKRHAALWVDPEPIRAVLAALAEAQRERDAMLAELRRVEWGEMDACPSCSATSDDGHDDDCRLAAVLAKADGEDER